MQAAADASKSGMVAVIGLDIATVEKVCAEATARTGKIVSHNYHAQFRHFIGVKPLHNAGKPIAIANYLVDGNYAVSGAIEACEAVKEIAPTMGARMAVPLAVAGAFHTDFMEPAVARLQAVLDEVEIKVNFVILVQNMPVRILQTSLRFQTPRIPVISNVDAKPHYDAADIKSILARQVTNPVQWETIITTMVKSPEFTKVRN